MILDKDEVRLQYRRVAPFYGSAHLAYKLFGIEKRRRELIGALNLRRGDTVLDLGCGTGINFAMLQNAVGPTGRIVAIDISGAMLKRAETRIKANGWSNVELREDDLSTTVFPADAAAVIATFALEMVPDYAAILTRLARTLAGGRRIALMGAKEPVTWPEPLIDIGVFLLRPFGVSRDYATFQPWVALGKCASIVRFEEFLGGAAYDCIGETVAGQAAVVSSR